MKHTLVYTSDLHGNAVQYRKLVDYAINIAADSVVIGGDLAPKGRSVSLSFEELKKRGLSLDTFIAIQRIFFEEQLPALVRPLHEKSIPLFLLMGNDDCRENYGAFEKGETDALYQIIHGKRISLNADFDLVGYSFVPITPFGIKDWEKFDFSDIPPSFKKAYAKRKKENYALAGHLSTFNGWEPFQFTATMEQADSIQKDLAQILFRERPDKTIVAMHCPPNDTPLDVISTGEHVGSFAERLFIEECQPYATLHGHIHETVNMSGNFQHRIGKTVSMASGNHNVGETLALLQMDLYDVQNCKRILL